MSDSMSDHEIPLWVELAASKGAEKALAALPPRGFPHLRREISEWIARPSMSTGLK